LQLVAAGLETIGDVLEKEQAEDDVLVLGGVDLPAQGVGGLPELGRKIQIGVCLCHIHETFEGTLPVLIRSGLTTSNVLLHQSATLTNAQLFSKSLARRRVRGLGSERLTYRVLTER